MINSLTIDLEDWYHAPLSITTSGGNHQDYESRVVQNTNRLLGTFSEFDVKVTFFVLGEIAEKNPQLINQISKEGHEIGLHGFHHQRVSHLTPQQFREDIEKCLDIVQAIIGKEIIGYRAPMFSIKESSAWCLEILEEIGVMYDSSMFPIRNFYYGNPNASRYPYHPIKGSTFLEFPVATYQFLRFNIPSGGGFYVRAFPYRILKAGINQLNRQGHPAIIYFHPWEFDLEQSYHRLTMRELLTHFYGRTSLEVKITKMLKDYKFAPLSILLKTMQLPLT